ncbi:MAG TPA: GntR family transcriptional regulator [Terracidiphilus sp.]|nr:GntR family transcriptional regulator [Terracidiphilus sp.]
MANQKYREISRSLQNDISLGRYQPGDRLPSEIELVDRFAASRMTIFRAMRELQALGIVERKVGSGTYVSKTSKADGYVFGLLIPELGQTEIFELICRGMVQSPLAASHSLSWGHNNSAGRSPGEIAEQLCAQFIEQKVSGVFFSPPYKPPCPEANSRVLQALDNASIPVVLLDRCALKYPEHSDHDLVGIDNRRAGYIVTDHLVRQGGVNVVFYTSGTYNETVDDRIAGFHSALLEHDLVISKKLIIRGDPGDRQFVEKVLRKQKIDSIMCANDYVAATLMQTLIGLGVRIPDDIRIAGIDDFRYAALMPVPLTTYRQPCDEIGAISIATMLERIRNRDLPARSIQLNGRLVVRQSTGSHAQSKRIPPK